MELIYVAWVVATLLCVACGVYLYRRGHRDGWRAGVDFGRLQRPDGSGDSPSVVVVPEPEPVVATQQQLVDPWIPRFFRLWHKDPIPEPAATVRIKKQKQDMIDITRCVWEEEIPRCPFTR